MYSFGVAVSCVTISNVFFWWTTTLIAVPHMNEKMELNLLLLHGCYPKGGVSCFADTFVVNQTLVLRMNICGKNRQLLAAATRCASCYGDSANLELYCLTLN